jgi:dihydropteroate synthase
LSYDQAIDHAAAMIADGADVIEVGGESTRPGASPVDAATEIARVLPVIKELTIRWPSTRVAIDTVKSEVAAAALDAGATIVNDVSGFRLDRELGHVCAAAGCTVILMHSRGTVATMASYQHAEYTHNDVVGAVVHELGSAADRALAAGVLAANIILDPGLGFSKRPEQSVLVLANLPRLLELPFRVMVGASRKRFIGELTGVQKPDERGAGTVGVNVAALTLGASWFRVHDVRENRQALDAAAAILEART